MSNGALVRYWPARVQLAMARFLHPPATDCHQMQPVRASAAATSPQKAAPRFPEGREKAAARRPAVASEMAAKTVKVCQKAARNPAQCFAEAAVKEISCGVHLFVKVFFQRFALQGLVF